MTWSMGEVGSPETVGARRLGREAWDLGALADDDTKQRACGDPGGNTASTRGPGRWRTVTRARARAGGLGTGGARGPGRGTPPGSSPRPAWRQRPPQPPRRPQEEERKEEETQGPCCCPHGAQRALLDHGTPSTARDPRGWGRGGRGRHSWSLRLAPVTLSRATWSHHPLSHLRPREATKGETQTCRMPTATAVPRVRLLPQAWLGSVATKSP